LERLLQRFHELQIEFGEIIVSDDCSKQEHQEVLELLQGQFNFKLIKGKINKGLGNNINKGQDAVSLPFTLYVQEDFEPKEQFITALKDAYNFMENDPELDYVRFYAFRPYPYLIPYEKGFSKMKFNLLLPDYDKYYVYTDHPHIRRSTFLNKFGRYAENFSGDQIEFRMMISFLQNKGKALYYDNHKELFDHDNLGTEPSTMKRDFWRNSKSPFIVLMRYLYRHLKFNYNYLFIKHRY
jgi:glycosyltransferase involved in cell wall biosynthesis